ncbi:nucleoside diphosphate-linked moiety X motif 8 isoform X3 [Camelus ferus]|uniref:Nucleoside diphosphate-linked moiety X motif 8 isoform X3 n=1 Tax=Camelus ferus TaxID=419612 RepID=A0A8B8TUB8_CAMFR|nr:nucleoside diphosphate-linked moiety X motif 8 isoform X3 [Camelus ferus]
MLSDCLSAEGERRCRRLLAGATARLRARPAAAAVLVPLCSVRGVPALLYTLRSSRLAGRHKGDVSFPGGKRDPTDRDVVQTALRETREELGLVVPEEHVWGVLRPLQDQPKASVVPVLAGVGPLDLQSLRPNPEEPCSGSLVGHLKSGAHPAPAGNQSTRVGGGALRAPTLHTPDPRPTVTPAICSTPQLDPEPEGDSDDSTTLGTLEFTLLFDADNSNLHCTAHRAQGLKPPASGSVDTYVKANLLPGASKASQLRTRTVRGTRGPVWEETLTYHGFTLQDAQRKTLWLCMCEDPWLRQRRRATPLGELQVPLRKLVPNRARSFNVCLEKRRLTKRPKSLDAACGMSLYEEDEVEMEAAGEDRGRILLSLCYSSQRGGLLVGVLRCAHLAPMDANGYSDPFVRLFLHPNVGKKSKYKTSVWKKTLNPEFNEEFFYAGPREELAQKTLLISVWDYDLGTADDFIGGVQLSSQASGECQQHWHECLGHSNHRLELWHPLDSAPLQLSD